MKTSSFVAKLTLIVHAGILVCLVVLVWKLWPPSQPPDSGANLELAPAPALATESPHRPVPTRSIPRPQPASTETSTSADSLVTAPPVAEPNFKAVLVGLQAALGERPTPERTVEVAPEPDVFVPPGIIFGQISLKGTPPPETTIKMDAICGTLHTAPITTRHYVVGEGKGLGDVFVYLQSGAPKTSLKGKTPLLDQKDCMFEPYIWGVMAGQEFNVRNSDNVLHNVHATPKINKEFNFGQPIRMVSKMKFEKSELLVRIKCDVHPWMFTYANVVEHPYYAVSDSLGRYQLPLTLPPGRYVIAAVHRRAGTQTKEAMLREGETIELDFTFEPHTSDGLASTPISVQPR